MAAARKAKVDLVSTVDQAVAAMHWLTPADQVTVELARKYAAEIEDAAIRDAVYRAGESRPDHQLDIVMTASARALPWPSQRGNTC